MGPQGALGLFLVKLEAAQSSESLLLRVSGVCTGILVALSQVGGIHRGSISRSPEAHRGAHGPPTLDKITGRGHHKASMGQETGENE